MVPGAGLEPALLSEEDFKSSVSAIPPPGQQLFSEYSCLSGKIPVFCALFYSKHRFLLEIRKKDKKMEAWIGVEPIYAILQTAA